ncbi:hypothetical protein EKK58_10060 [Candidatus Dependentiae bacterium]|nr:MAG: hypothetical protein EKK58_10060 [Candidatus Dependentiae bacterium]
MAKYNGELYLSLQDTNLNKNPSSETAWWSSILGSRAVQTGVIQAYGGSSAPTGYLLCDGSAVSRSTYSALFAIVGTSFGSGDGSTTFNLPDLRTKVPAGYKSGDDTFGTLGASVGSKTVNLQHSHGGVATPITQSSSPNTSPQGVNIGDQHREQYATIANDLSSVQSIVQPSLTINYIIKT